MKRLKVTYVTLPSPLESKIEVSLQVYGIYNEIDAIDYSSILQGGRNDVTKFLSHHTVHASWTQITALWTDKAQIDFYSKSKQFRT